MSGALLLGVAACSPLEPILEPDSSDLQLTVDTLRMSLRDAQRTIAELQTEIERHHQEYAGVQIARAQLEGSHREAERRLIEARHVIDLQREELAVARGEREQMRKTRAPLQSQLRQPRKQSPIIGKQAKGETTTAAIISQSAERLDLMSRALKQEAQPDGDEESVDSMSFPSVEPVVTRSPGEGTHVDVVIRPGDTLWSFARQYQTSVKHLMTINDLSNDRIQVGQTLRLP